MKSAKTGKRKRSAKARSSATAHPTTIWTCLDCKRQSYGPPPYLNHAPSCWVSVLNASM